MRTLAFSLSLACAAPLGASVDEPAAVVGQLQEALLAASKSPETPFADRASRLRATIESTYDLDAIGMALAAAVEVDAGDGASLGGPIAALLAAEWAGRLEGLELDGASELQETTLDDGGHAFATSLERKGEKVLELEYLVYGEGSDARVRAVRGGDRLERWASDLSGQVARGDAAALASALERRAKRFDQTPTEVVQGFQGSLIASMKKAEELGYRGRYERMQAAVGSSHDLPAMAKLSLAQAWAKLSSEERSELVASFRKLSYAAYAANFDGYGGEVFNVLSAQEMRRGTLVKSIFTKRDGGLVHFDYLLHRRGGKWLIVNVIVDGVSDLALKRAEYGAIVEKDGAAGLLAKLSDQIVKYEGGSKD